MAKKAKTGDSANPRMTNLSETKETIRDAVRAILSLKNERKEINSAIAEERAKVVNCGVPKAALDLAIRMKEMDVEDRNAIDEGYAIARDALGMGLQLSMFENQDPQPDESDESDKPSDEPEVKASKGRKSKVTPFNALTNARAHQSGDTTEDAAA